MAASNLPVHILRYGIHGEQRYFSELADCYDGIAINGNMLAHTPAALARFVGVRVVDRPFVIDPLTHAFQHDPQRLRRAYQGTLGGEGTALKSSVARMSTRFGEPVQSKAGREALLPEDFADGDLRRDFCHRVIEFQLQTMEEAAADGDYIQYLRYAGIQTMKPAVVIAPYFYMISNTLDHWLDLNIAFISDAVSYDSGLPVYAQLVIHPDILLRQDMSGRLITSYGSARCAGICLWIDELDEHSADAELLRRMAGLIEGLAASGRPVHNVYGGYLSTVLTKFGRLSGLCHGLEYGESRPVLPVGGGVPMARYYFPPLHKRIRYSEVVQILAAKGWNRDASEFHANVCDCETCHEVISGNVENFAMFGGSRAVTFQRAGQTITLNYPLPETRDRCLRHYLHCKRKEFRELQASTKEEVIARLRTGGQEYRSVLGLDAVAFVDAWVDVLDSL